MGVKKTSKCLKRVRRMSPVFGKLWGASKGSWKIKVVVPGGQGGVYWVPEGQGGHLKEPRLSRGARESQGV